MLRRPWAGFKAFSGSGLAARARLPGCPAVAAALGVVAAVVLAVVLAVVVGVALEIDAVEDHARDLPVDAQDLIESALHGRPAAGLGRDHHDDAVHDRAEHG